MKSNDNVLSDVLHRNENILLVEALRKSSIRQAEDIMLVDLTYVNNSIPDEDVILKPADIIIRCPDQYLALDILEAVDEIAHPDFYEEDDEEYDEELDDEEFSDEDDSDDDIEICEMIIDIKDLNIFSGSSPVINIRGSLELDFMEKDKKFIMEFIEASRSLIGELQSSHSCHCRKQMVSISGSSDE